MSFAIMPKYDLRNMTLVYIQIQNKKLKAIPYNDYYSYIYELL